MNQSNINAIITAAINRKRPTTKRLMHPLTLDADSVAETCAVWAQQRKAALSYIGPDVDTLERHVTQANKAVTTATEALRQVELQIFQQHPSAFAVVGAEVNPALITQRYDASKTRAEAMKKRDYLGLQHAEAQKYAQAVEDLTAILAALIGKEGK
ncbi:hypothetical protein [Cupriavidus necator]